MTDISHVVDRLDDLAFDAKSISDVLDFINVAIFYEIDFAGAESGVTHTLKVASDRMCERLEALSEELHEYCLLQGKAE